MLRVAICDDQEIFINMISDEVTKWSKCQKGEVEIQCTSSGVELLELIERSKAAGERFDVVLLDIQMDGLWSAGHRRRG